MTNESSSMTMKSDNESKLVNTTSNNNNNNNIYYNCTSNSSSNKLPIIIKSPTTTSSVNNTVAAAPIVTTVGGGAPAVAAASSDLPSITLAPFAKIKREAISTDHHLLHQRLSSSSTISMVTKSISSSSSSHNNTTNICNNNSQVPAVNANSVSAKMGSRRIFTPQFKLQVLESYRNDSDCKGNQRATARKYNIHRRQIQKWLQCESNLRSSVANISANNVKHQFHNISHQMPIVATSTSSASSSIHTNHNHHHHHHIHHNQQYKGINNNRLSLDTSRHSVALASIPIQTSSKPATQGVLAAVAAAANAGDVGAVAPLSSPSKSLHHAPSTTSAAILHHPQILTKSTTTVTPTVAAAAAAAALQCTKGGGGIGPVIGGPATTSTALTQLHTPYHSMGIHTPPALLTSVPVSVPIITPHPHTHLHLANLKSDYHQHLHIEQQQHHHHHHHIYNQVLQPLLPPPPQTSERRPFMPSASLPVLPTSSSSSSSSSCSSSSPSSSSSSSSLAAAAAAAASTASSPPASMTAVALSCTDTSAATPAFAMSLVPQRTLEENRIDELRDYQTTKTVVAENRYMNENEYAAVHSRTQLQCAFEGFHYYMPLNMHPVAATAMIAPIDLSLGTKRLDYALSSSSSSSLSLSQNSRTFIETSNVKHELSTSPKEDDNDDSHLNVVDSDYVESSVVDLTLRKRKVLMPTASEPETVSAEKHTKLSNEQHDYNNDADKDHDKPVHEPAKTFKLFKPYLLGDEDKSTTDGDKETANKISKQKDPIIWSHHTACLSPPMSHDSRQCSSRGSNFQSPSVDTYPFPAGSPTFQPANASQVVTASSFRCPKGSPVSGYESSSSIYSDSASSNGGDHPCNSLQHATYSFDLKVHNINGDLADKHLISNATNCIQIPPTNINHVQRWLDQESGIRQSIALYV